MTDEELLAFCALEDTPNAREYISQNREILEKMEQVCAWDAGVAPRPDGVLVDYEMPRAWPKRGVISSAKE